jgi:hypothetical protein
MANKKLALLDNNLLKRLGLIGIKDRNKLGNIEVSENLLKGNTLQVGIAATGVTAIEHGTYNHKVTVLTVNTTLPAIAGGANLAVGKLLYTFPAGIILVKASHINLAVTQTEDNITADTPDGGLGTTLANGAVAVLGGTAAFENMLTGQTFADCDGTAKNVTLQTPLVINAADNHTVYFNIADGWAASGDVSALLTGTVVLEWIVLNQS